MYRRGIVQELRPAKAQARVEFRDRDEVVSWWLDVNQAHASAGKNRIYAMPDVGAQVNCLVDEKAEAGTIIGAIYSDEDPPPITDAKHTHGALQGGLVFDYDRVSGTLTITTPGDVALTAINLRIVGDVAIEGRLYVNGSGVSHNGKNIGDDHAHKDVTPGPGVTGPPV